MKKLRIAQVAPSWYPIPPEKYGGIERIASFLTEELVKRGHKVTLFASGDSKTKARLISPYKKSLVKLGFPWSENILNVENLYSAYKRVDEFDIIHSHIDHLTVWFAGLFPEVQSVITAHNPMSVDASDKSSKIELYKLHNKELNCVFISKNQKENSSVKFKKNSVIYNGIDISKFKFNATPDDYFMWAGRFDPYKGVESAIFAARKANVNLILAGKVDKGREDYFRDKIKPFIGGKIKYVGELDEHELIKLFQKAKAFLYPIEWEEPFGLVVAEAMACGTPVIAYNKGSMSELIKDGKTGFLVNNRRELIKAMGRVDKINRHECRLRVEKNFSIETMVDGYEKLYYQLHDIHKKK